MSEMRGKCRTCRFLATNEGNTSTGYCWQCDMPVVLKSYSSFPGYLDPDCKEIIGDDSAWEPLDILQPYFESEMNE